MKMARVLRVLILTVMLAAFGTPAEAVDMTGTWAGKERCRCFNERDARSTLRYKDEVMEVTQDGTDLNVEAYGELFNGNVIDHPRSSSKGEAALIACKTDPTDNASFGEIGRAKVWARDGGRGRMIVESLWTPQEAEICTCKGRFQRTDLADPEIDDCSGGDPVDKWHVAMLDLETPGAGCYEVEYPSRDWVAVECGEPLTEPLGTPYGRGSQRGARVVGGGPRGDGFPGAGYMVTVPGPNDLGEGGHTLSRVTGSFQNVIGLVSIKDSRLKTQDTYGLQMNSNHFKSPACDSAPNPRCHGWQQAGYFNNGIGKDGKIIIQWWLFNYNHDEKTCPPGWQWIHGSYHCMLTGPAKYDIEPVAIEAFQELHLTMDTSHAGTDEVVLRIGGTDYDPPKLHKASATIESHDKKLDLSKGWTQAEFNVFGYGEFSKALFNEDAVIDGGSGPISEVVSMDVKLNVGKRSGGQVWCRLGSTTGETNSLSLDANVGCQPYPATTPPAFFFRQVSTPPGPVPCPIDSCMVLYACGFAPYKCTLAEACSVYPTYERCIAHRLGSFKTF